MIDGTLLALDPYGPGARLVLEVSGCPRARRGQLVVECPPFSHHGHLYGDTLYAFRTDMLSMHAAHFRKEVQMGLLDLPSSNSLWRGYDYYKAGNVVSVTHVDSSHLSGLVKGSEGATYEVTVDLDHPKRSTCTCPFAMGRQVICKHEVALYFTAFPREADELLRRAEQWEKDEESRQQEQIAEIQRYVKSLSKAELQKQLLWRLVDEEVYGKSSW